MNLKFLSQIFLGNMVSDYVMALAVLVFGLIFVKLFFMVIIPRLKKIAEKTVTTLDDLLMNIAETVVSPLLYLSCFYVSLKMLKTPALVGMIFNAMELAIITFFVTRLVLMVIEYGLNLYVAKKQEGAALVRSLYGMLGVFKYIIWAAAVIIYLDNIGFKVSAIIAGLGIGGVAVAIAAQTVLKDFFSYFSILFDRPFKLGDFIIIGDFMGTVEYIGIKTTRIRSLGGEQVIFSNTDLTDSRVRNYKLMEKRRILFRIGVTYQTPLDKLKEIPKIIEDIIRRNSKTAFDRAHFFSYGDFSLIFEIVYFVLNPEYNKYMDIQQEINFAIKEEFEKRGIGFAYPTQTLYLQKS